MNTLQKINRAKEETAKDILNRIGEIYDDAQYRKSKEDLFEEITNYINKEYLFKNDYTK